MDAVMIKQEFDAVSQCSAGRNNEDTCVEGNLDPPRLVYEKFYRKQYFFHVTDSEMVFEIVIRNTFDIVDETGESENRQLISQNDAACLLGFIGLDSEDITKCLKHESMGKDKKSVNDNTCNNSGKIGSVSSEKTINKRKNKKRPPQRTKQTDLCKGPSEVEISPPMKEPNSRPTLEDEDVPNIKSEFMLDSDDSTDEYSDNDFGPFVNYNSVQKLESNNDVRDQPRTQTCVTSKIDAKDTKIQSVPIQIPQPSSSLKKDRTKRKICIIGGKRYRQCSECDYMSIYSNHLARHIQYKHSKERAFQCSVCNFKFKAANDLRRHMERKHTGVLPFRCSVCDYRCDKSRELKQHEVSEHKVEQPFACLDCHHKFDNEALLKKHVSNNHSIDNPFACSECTFRFPDDLALKEHFVGQHGGGGCFECPTCDYTSKTSLEMTKHEKNKHPSQMYECLDCDQKCSKLNDLKQHILSIHSTERIYECTQCDYKSVKNSQLKLHKRNKHSDSSSFTCSKCYFETLDEDELRKHVKAKHNKARVLECSACDHSTTSFTNLKKHITIHHPGRLLISKSVKKLPIFTRGVYKCDECDYTCMQAGMLERHMRKHTLPFMCHMCSFRTTKACNLDRHIMSRHTGEKPQQCQECPYRCINASRLKAHVKLKHRGERPPSVLCPICGISQYGDLDRHIVAKHTGEKSFECTFCDYRCNRAGNLRQHVKRRHTGETFPK